MSAEISALLVFLMGALAHQRLLALGTSGELTSLSASDDVDYSYQDNTLEIARVRLESSKVGASRQQNTKVLHLRL